MATQTLPVLGGGVAADTASNGNTIALRDASGNLAATTFSGGHAVTSNLSLALSAKTANYSAGTVETVIVCDATAGGFTVTLPSAASCTNRVYVVKKINSANTVSIVDAGAATLDGAASISLTSQWSVSRLVSNGTVWFTI